MNQVRIPIALQQAVMRRLRDALALANQKLKQHYPEPLISYQQRGTTAGSAHLARWEIRLNSVLLLENQQHFIDEVIPHELAHLLVFRRFGRVAPHGNEWRWMMKEILQVTASRTHHFAVASVQGKTFTYQCACQQHQLTIRRHNRIIKQEMQYRCRQCGEILSFAN